MSNELLKELEALARGEKLPTEDSPSVHGRIPSMPSKPLANEIKQQEPLINPPKKAGKRKTVALEATVYREGSLDPVERIKWPFPDMEVGHWFAVHDSKKFQRARLAASAYGKRTGKQITCQTDENGSLILTRRK